nr:hypothetical protein [uncultured Psychroserpens sp.]
MISQSISFNLEKHNSIETEQVHNNFSTAIKWWERKRLIYNIITLIGGLLVIFIRGDVPNGISPYSDFTIILFWLFGANIFYTCGWAFEALLNYYFKTSFFGNNIRNALFVLGAVFSFMWMFFFSKSNKIKSLFTKYVELEYTTL